MPISGRLLLCLSLTGLGSCALDSTVPSSSAMYLLRRVGGHSLPAAAESGPQVPIYIADTLLLSPSGPRGARFNVYRITVLQVRGERSRSVTRLEGTRRDNLLSIQPCPLGDPCPASVSSQPPSLFRFVGEMLMEDLPPGSRLPPRAYSRVRE